jgi:hypothetical protein
MRSDAASSPNAQNDQVLKRQKKRATAARSGFYSFLTRNRFPACYSLTAVELSVFFSALGPEADSLFAVLLVLWFLPE